MQNPLNYYGNKINKIVRISEQRKYCNKHLKINKFGFVFQF